MTAPLPLAHLTVLDLTAHRAGPTAVRQLADWGADVIKIEPPGSKCDAAGGTRHGFDFQNLHRNKRSLTLNLKSPEGHAIFMQLAAKADVVVENYRSDVKHRLKVAYDRFAWRRLVHSTYGRVEREGALADAAGRLRLA